MVTALSACIGLILFFLALLCEVGDASKRVSKAFQSFVALVCWLAVTCGRRSTLIRIRDVGQTSGQISTFCPLQSRCEFVFCVLRLFN
jgi:hypothetical protein